MNGDLQNLRSQLKKRRAMLDHEFVASASQTFAENFWRLPFVKRAQRIAVYMSTRGEIDCQPIMEMAWMRKKSVFAPVLSGKQLNFAPVKPDSKLLANRFNILEPVYSTMSLIQPQQLDFVVVPLVAFD